MDGPIAFQINYTQSNFLWNVNVQIAKVCIGVRLQKLVSMENLALGVVITAELLLLKLIHLFAREVLLVKMLEIEETKTI